MTVVIRGSALPSGAKLSIGYRQDRGVSDGDDRGSRLTTLPRRGRSRERP